MVAPMPGQLIGIFLALVLVGAIIGLCVSFLRLGYASVLSVRDGVRKTLRFLDSLRPPPPEQRIPRGDLRAQA